MTAKSQMLSPNSLWERLRNPLSGWARVTLILILPFVIWTHNPLLIVLMLLALASHPFWFPPVRGSANNDIMTRAVDGTREWLRTASLYERTLIYYCGIVMFGTSVVLLWDRHWMGALLYICMLGFKIIAIAMIFEKLDNISYEAEAAPKARKAVFDDEDV
jgi:hypothetical protein